MPGSVTTYDLLVIGGSSGGLSAAVFARECGLERVVIVEPGAAVAFPDILGEHSLDAAFGERITAIDVIEGSSDLAITSSRRTYRAKACLVAKRSSIEGWKPPVPSIDSDRVLIDRLPDPTADVDVLVVGHTDHAVELTVAAAEAGAAGVVLAAGGMRPNLLSPIGEQLLHKLEHERQATLLYRSLPTEIDDVGGYPMAYFADRRTPDLQFDAVVFSSGRRPLTPADVGCTDAALATGNVWFLGEEDETPDNVPTAPAWRAGPTIIEKSFPDVTLPEAAPTGQRRSEFPGAVEELRKEHYNATITHFEPTHSDLWVLRVKPDHGSVSHLPGQYASLGLGHWEDRIDDAIDPGLDDKWDKLVRRSYSISHRIFDDHGYLADESAADELEFYIVLVAPTEDNVPGLTPRLALKKPGDRIYLGPKVAGRYTLGPVTDPEDTVLFLSTGTGEAPQNAMVTELLRKGHRGPIVSAVSVRKWADLGYLDKHRTLEKHYANYHYFPMPTREPDVQKRYIQDLIRDDVFKAEYGIELDAEHTHVFLCGNPAMIGLPEESKDGGAPAFPEVEGVVELLVNRGFKLDQRKDPGNIHYEEYW